MTRLAKLRLMGDPGDVAAVAEHLQAALGSQIAERSEVYPNRRGGRVRVYLAIAPPCFHNTRTLP